MNIKDFYKILPVPSGSDKIKMGQLDGYALAAPESFWTFLDQDMSDVVNGCGPGGAGDRLVPDTAYGLSLKSACKIHDWCFTIYNDEDGFKLSNQLFIDNMHRINRQNYQKNPGKVSAVLKFMRSIRILKYYRAVRDFGRLFYYDNHLDLYGDQVVYA